MDAPPERPAPVAARPTKAGTETFAERPLKELSPIAHLNGPAFLGDSVYGAPGEGRDGLTVTAALELDRRGPVEHRVCGLGSEPTAATGFSEDLGGTEHAAARHRKQAPGDLSDPRTDATLELVEQPTAVR
jgi:hypothetical protein